jgi:hypothetical protein
MKETTPDAMPHAFKNGAVGSMMFSAIKPKKKGLGTIWADYWGKVSEKI